MIESPVIVGIDEAGRGPLAGPVVAGACVEIAALRRHPLIRDSKTLTAEEREEAYAWIAERCTFGIGIAESSVIDAQGILAATESAMQQAVCSIARVVRPTFLIVDGRDKFWFDYAHTSIIDGDELEPAIAAASILAKVTRDRLMCELAQEYPHYRFDVHKGYGTPLHREMLTTYGPCPIHRRTFLTSLPSLPSSSSTTTTPPRR